MLVMDNGRKLFTFSALTSFLIAGVRPSIDRLQAKVGE